MITLTEFDGRDIIKTQFRRIFLRRLKMFDYKVLQKTIFDFSYGAALGDATGQKAFEGNKKPLRNNEGAKEIARKYIDEIIAGENPDFYETTKELEKSFNKYIKDNKSNIEYTKKNGEKSEPVFRFGNSQKLINMLAKNMFLLVYQNKDLRDSFSQCHCPMDNEMIKNVKKELKKSNDAKAEELLKKYRESEKVAWSRIECRNTDQYEIFQKCVQYLADKEGLSPIEYDYWMWKKDSLSDENNTDSADD
jgi:hypothetical protein